MELTVLAVPGCPNARLLEERLAEAIADMPGVRVRRVEITDEEAAARHGMSGSPTLLVNGSDPFANSASGPSLACRLYRDGAGRRCPAPSAADLRAALGQPPARPGSGSVT